jgi:predicted lipid-binding transport protein (Tim44 family)
MLHLIPPLLARAGGGHSFSGGGSHSSGGGFHSGGGGGFFFFGGGGGGGGGIGIAVIIFLIIIVFAIYIVMRSRRGGGRGGGLGGPASATAGGYGGSSSSASASPSGGFPPPSTPWSGSEEPAINSVRGDLFPGTATAVHHGTTTVQDGLNEIKAHDPAFNEEVFLESVQRAFFVVQEAWTERKPDMSRQVMADGIWQQHRVQIQQYVNEHKRNVLEDLAVGDLQIIAAHSDQTYDTITTRVLAACADYDVNDENNKIVRGNKGVDQWQEDWTWQRSSSATTKTGGGTLSSKCPNCGAPLDLDLQGVCKFCHAPVMSGKYDWVLARIAQVTS